MSKKPVEICLEFCQLNVFSERIPSEPMFEGIPSKRLFERVVDRYPNAGDRQLFCELSNRIVAELNKIINPLPGTHEFERLEDMKLLAILSGLSIPKLLHSLAVTQWMIITIGNFTGGDRQKLIKGTTKLIKFKKGKIEIDKLDSVVCKEYPSLTDYIEYQIADNYINLFFSKTRYLHDRHTELYGVYEKLEKSYFMFTCPFCHSLSVIEQGKTPKTCESDKCKKLYSASTSARNRSQPHTSNKRANTPRSFDGRANFCDECRKRRVLHQFTDGNFCRECRGV
jgi:hypothetical protein